MLSEVVRKSVRMLDFDYYIQHGEPSQREKAEAWAVAIGLQDVDGLKKRYEHIDWKEAQKVLKRHEPINEPINFVLCYIRQHGGCKRKDIAEALGMTLISVKRALIGLSEKIEYRGSNKTGGYYAR